MKTTLLAVAAACACPLIGIGGDMYGVCAHISRPGEFETRIEEMCLMKEAGIGWCRTDFDWKYVEPRQGEWTFGHLDRLMDDGLTQANCGDLEKHAYSVNDGIAEAQLRNLHILAAV